MGNSKKKNATPEAGKAPASGPVVGVETTTAAETSTDQSSNAGAMDTSTTCSSLERFTIVVLGTAEALPLLTKVWKRKAAGATIIPIEVGDGPFSETIDQLLADENIPDTFSLVPANCFPTHRIGHADLVAYRVRRMKSGPNSDGSVVTPRTGLPFLFAASAALQTLERLNDTYSEEEFLEAYNEIAHPDELPEEVGMTFGNTVGYAVKRPKCMATVVEALVRKRFICTNDEGFVAIKERLALLVKDE